MSRPALLDEVLDAHGGLERWSRVGEVRARVSASGLMFRSRMTGGALASFRATVSAHEPRSLLEPYPRPGLRGVFRADEVRIESGGGEAVDRRADPRRAFRSPRRAVRWDDLDTLYFAGYAIWNYLTTPFLLAAEGVEAREAEPVTIAGERLRRLVVRFPAGLPTHSPEQTFHYDARLRLRRHDYTAEPFGRWARGAHRCLAHETAGGFLFATRRRVVPRGPGGRELPGPTLVSVAIRDVEVA